MEIPNTGGQATDDNIIRRMRIGSWITNATNTLIIYSIIAFLLQQLLHERVSMLRYTYIACLVYSHPYVIRF